MIIVYNLNPSVGSSLRPENISGGKTIKQMWFCPSWPERVGKAKQVCENGVKVPWRIAVVTSVVLQLP